MSKAKDSVPGSGQSGSPKKPRKTEAAFDMWLQKGLHDIFDTVAREPIPEDLLRLIEEDRKR